MGEIVKCYLKGKTCSKLANGLNIYDLKKENDSKGCSDLALGLYNSIVKQLDWNISQVSGERLQDRWSSGLCFGVGRGFVLFKP